MSKNKFGKYVLVGAMAGGVISLFDRRTREQVFIKTRSVGLDFKFYATNPDALRSKVQEKTEKYQSIYEQFSNDATYLKEKVDELKRLTPQVKDMVVDTKETFSDSKDEYKSIANEE